MLVRPSVGKRICAVQLLAYRHNKASHWYSSPTRNPVNLRTRFVPGGTRSRMYSNSFSFGILWE